MTKKETDKRKEFEINPNDLITINNVGEYINKVLEHKLKRYPVYYRGERKIYEFATPNVYRDKELIKDGTEFYYRSLLSELGRDDYNSGTELFRTLSEFQHYGAKTRILDITSNPLVALFFATEPKEADEGEDGIITLFQTTDSRDMKFDTGHTVAIKSALNLMPQENINQFISICSQLVGNNRMRKLPTNELIDEAIIKTSEKNELKEFMGLLNQRAKKNEYLCYPMKVYADMMKAHIVIPGKCTDRIRQQQGLFIMPAHVSTDVLADKNKDNLDEDVNARVEESVKKLLLRDKENAIIGYRIPYTQKKKINNELRALGITAGYIYPEIENVSKSIPKNWKR